MPNVDYMHIDNIYVVIITAIMLHIYIYIYIYIECVLMITIH